MKTTWGCITAALAIAGTMLLPAPAHAAPAPLPNTPQCTRTLSAPDHIVAGINFTSSSGPVTYLDVVVGATGADLVAYADSPFDLVWDTNETNQYRFELDNVTPGATLDITYFDDTGQTTVNFRLEDLPTFQCMWAAPITSLVSSNNPATPGSTATYTAGVTPQLITPGIPQPTGTVDFTFDGAALGGPETLVTNQATSDPTGPLATGNHTVEASYSGDAWYIPATRQLTQVVSAAQPTLTTTASDTVEVGELISDTGVLAGGVNPTGTISFSVFGPDDATCAGGPVYVLSTSVNGNGSYHSGWVAAPTAGTYRWTASYSGDASNLPADSPCNAPNESVVVTKATPTLTAVATPQGTYSDSSPASISSTATIDGYVPGGNLVFEVFGPDDATCAGPPAATYTVPVNDDGSYTSPSFQTSQPGTYRWVVTYGGDVNNNGVSVPCNSPNSFSVVSACPAPDPRTFAGTVIYAVPGEITAGTDGPDLIFGTSGDDRINGLGGDDVIMGGDGFDQILGGPGNDTICGEGGDDWLHGDDGNDIVVGGVGVDDVYGENGDDRLYGESGFNRLLGGKGTDYCDVGPDPTSQAARCEAFPAPVE